MSNTHKSGSKKPRRRYFRRGGANAPKTGEAKSSNEPGSSESRPEKHTESRSSRRRLRSERRRNRDERSDSKGQRSGSGGLRRRSNSDARRRRQKRRRGELEQAEQAEQATEQVMSGPSIIEAIEREYKPPEAVYTYTHVVRADQRDAYEFRSDHFSHTSRHLEDYTIDLSPILTETGEIALKKFFQDIPNEEELDPTGLVEHSIRKSVNHPNTHPNTDDIQDSVEDDFEIGFEALFEESFQDLSGEDFEEGFEEGEAKSLEQIYDELEMFKQDMEI